MAPGPFSRSRSETQTLLIISSSALRRWCKPCFCHRGGKFTSLGLALTATSRFDPNTSGAAINPKVTTLSPKSKLALISWKIRWESGTFQLPQKWQMTTAAWNFLFLRDGARVRTTLCLLLLPEDKWGLGETTEWSESELESVLRASAAILRKSTLRSKERQHH